MDNIERYRRMKALREQGLSLRELSKEFGISHQRVSMILAAPEPKSHGGRPRAQEYSSRRWDWTTQVSPGVPLPVEESDCF